MILDVQNKRILQIYLIGLLACGLYWSSIYDPIVNKPVIDITEGNYSSIAGVTQAVNNMSSLTENDSSQEVFYKGNDGVLRTEEQVGYCIQADAYIANLEASGKDSEYIINEIIFRMREDPNFSLATKVTTIAGALEEFGNIKYKTGSNLFNWDNTLLDEDFLQPGCYYKSGMTFDCSGFIQYLIWISTGSSTKNGILIGRGTYYQSVEGVGLDEPTIGTLCFHYNGGSGVERIGEKIRHNEVGTSEANHVAIMLNSHQYLDCSESYGGIRIIDTDENPWYLDYFTWYRDVLQDENYITELEMHDGH